MPKWEQMRTVAANPDEVHIDVEEIPEHVIIGLVRSLIDAAMADYDDPEMQRRYRKWKREQRQKAYRAEELA